MLDANGTEQGHFEFASNNGCGNSGLGGHFFGIRTQTHTGYSYMMPYSDIFKGENYNGWHHYAFVWTPTRLAIFLDGKELCGTTGQLNTEAVTDSAITFDIPLNRRTGKSFNNKSAFYMDELKIWNFAKREFDIN
jgi:beta-glucanase (GH16 family)